MDGLRSFLVATYLSCRLIDKTAVIYYDARVLHRLLNYLLKNQILLALVLIALSWFVFLLRGVLVLLFLAYIIMAALQPAAFFLEKRKFPRVLAIFLPYLGIFIILFLLIFPIISSFTPQATSLVETLPKFIQEAGQSVGLRVNQHQFETYANDIIDFASQNAFTVTGEVFGSVIAIVTMLIVSFYLLLYHTELRNFIASFFPLHIRPQVHTTLSDVDSKLGAWLRGQLILSLSIGVTTWALLTLIHFPYALPLALLAGLLEILPTIGPIIAAIPAVIVAMTISSTWMIIIIALYLLVQLLETNLLVPKIMEHAVGLNPLVVIIGIMLGAELMGIAGALLAIPFISFVVVLYQSLEKFE